MSSDRIEKQVVLRAPLDRVWRAISDSGQFGQWFGVRIDGPFVAGASVTATITPTTVDEEVARLHLDALDVELTELSKEQAEYLDLDVAGPYKPEHYRY